MTHLSSIIEPDLLEQMIREGYLARKISPDDNKFLYCYTPRAQYDGVWNQATINARGLTVDAWTGEVLARPFPKFFNHGDEANAELPGLDTPVWALDKIDGSLAVLQPDGTMTSKGSFTSDVAQAATRLYQEKYAGRWKPVGGVTYCFEYTSPQNRIVLDYGPNEELTLLGAIDNGDGFHYLPGDMICDRWPGPSAKIMSMGRPFREVLEMPPRENAEGLVVQWGLSNAVKVKQEDYLRMHHLVSNVDAKTVWEHVAVNYMTDVFPDETAKSVAQTLKLSEERVLDVTFGGPDWERNLAEVVPDEFHQWVRDTRRGITLRIEGDIARLTARLGGMQEIESRKDAALHLQKHYGDDELPWNASLEVFLNHEELTPRALGAVLRKNKPKGGRWGLTGEEQE